MTELPPQIDAHDFRLKLIGIGVAVGVLLVYMIVSYLRGGGDFLGSGEADEEDRLKSGEVTLDRLQTGTWNVNFLKATTYSSISVSTVTLAAVFIFQQRLTSYDALFWNFVLVAATIATFFYFISIQMWFMAHDAGGRPEILLRYRRKATWFQNIGWMVLILAVVLVMTAVNTYAGWCATAVALPSIIYAYESKARLSKLERWSTTTGFDLDDVARLPQEARWSAAAKNKFQAGLSFREIYAKNSERGREQRCGSSEVKVLSWNINRGYCPVMIANYIKQVDPDIVCLQEVDWLNRRTKNADVLQEIAERTGMVGYYAVEFLEIDTPYRDKTLAGGGACGNAILTRLRPERCYRIDLPGQFDWGGWANSTARRQKRIGGRCAVVAEFAVGGKRLTVVSAHLESAHPRGAEGRDEQFQRLLRELKVPRPAGDPIVICGDLNTLENWATGLVGFNRGAPNPAKSWYRSECAWWKEKAGEEYGFHDPFACGDWTFRHAPLYRAKLDWILLQNCSVVQSGRGEEQSSDHRPLWATVGGLQDPQ